MSSSRLWSLEKEYPVSELGIFGSYTRGEQQPCREADRWFFIHKQIPNLMEHDGISESNGAVDVCGHQSPCRCAEIAAWAIWRFHSVVCHLETVSHAPSEGLLPSDVTRDFAVGH